MKGFIVQSVCILYIVSLTVKSHTRLLPMADALVSVLCRPWWAPPSGVTRMRLYKSLSCSSGWWGSRGEGASASLALLSTASVTLERAPCCDKLKVGNTMLAVSHPRSHCHVFACRGALDLYKSTITCMHKSTPTTLHSSKSSSTGMPTKLLLARRNECAYLRCSVLGHELL